MHADRFDALSRSLTAIGSRRLVLGGVLAGALALLGEAKPEEVAAKKCNQKDKK